jgi:hypothetical protein
VSAVLYLVSFGGAYEAPSYLLTADPAKAKATASEWQDEMDEDEGDFVDVIEFTGSDPFASRRLNDIEVEGLAS